MVVELDEAVVADCQLNGSSDGQSGERFNLNFTKITITPYEVKEGKATKGAVVSCNLPNMEANAWPCQGGGARPPPSRLRWRHA
jgi:type VI protein secretion system component Hcp